ncbi:MAG: integration host factor subunit alpha [Thermodesulfobacteria bacterium]|nr:integration host factor subunit alpha [Thermodesulfobacteriota bacterium]
MTLTKADLINKLYESEVLSKAEAVRAVETVIEIIKETLEDGENVLISGFGKFTVKDKKARRGRNPHTGEDLILAPRRVVTFKPSGVLRNKINQK